ncbi:MAG: hypothetical protein K8T91_09270 [Planctomycetes bacterium]|nr:hypothetical protein [Planctomycetota bacterium]
MAQTNLLIRIVGVAAGMVCWVGCGSSPPPTPALPAPMPQIKVEEIPDFPVRVMLNDKVLATYDRRHGGEYDYTTTAEIPLQTLPDVSAVKAQCLHPDGWKDGVARIVRGSLGPTIYVMFQLKPEEWKIKIGPQVDNRGGEATEIFVGALPQTIKANGKENLFYPAPSSAEHAVVRIGKKEVGTLWPASEKTAPDWEKVDFFVDVTGKRSYRYREVYYSTQGISVEGAEYLKLKPVEGELSGKFVHSVPFSFSYFLERAPNEIQMKPDISKLFEVRTEIVDR